MRPSAMRSLSESIEALLGGDIEMGKALLRDYINATVCFKQFGAETVS
jgi:hypothetical protein